MQAPEVVLVNAISGDTLEVDGLPNGLVIYTQSEVSLGALSYVWSAGPYTVPLSGTLVVPLDIPAAAFLHALAEDYLTDLRVRFEGTDNGQTLLRFRSDPLFLAWPDGQQGRVRVWNEATALSEAPNGIVDEALRAARVDLGSARVIAPLWEVGGPQFDAAELRAQEE